MLQLLFLYVVFSVTHSKLAKTKMVYPYNVGAQVAMDFTTFWVKKWNYRCVNWLPEL